MRGFLLVVLFLMLSLNSVFATTPEGTHEEDRWIWIGENYIFALVLVDDDSRELIKIISVIPE